MGGGVHATVFSDLLLASGETDYVIHNEGEVTTVNLINALANGDELGEVKGISYMEDGLVRHNPPQPMVEDLDTIPFPAWHLLEWEQYRLFNFARVASPATLVL